MKKPKITKTIQLIAFLAAHKLRIEDWHVSSYGRTRDFYTGIGQSRKRLNKIRQSLCRRGINASVGIVTNPERADQNQPMIHIRNFPDKFVATSNP